jgi:hypothetical protein
VCGGKGYIGKDEEDMSDDKELLELAARAFGINTKRALQYSDGAFDLPDGRWNPLTDDGDALRLAVMLRLHVDHLTDTVSVWVMSRNSASGLAERYEEFSGNDSYAATRRAIVRAAAEIGKMKQ